MYRMGLMALIADDLPGLDRERLGTLIVLCESVLVKFRAVSIHVVHLHHLFSVKFMKIPNYINVLLK